MKSLKTYLTLTALIFSLSATAQRNHDRSHHNSGNKQLHSQKHYNEYIQPVRYYKHGNYGHGYRYGKKYYGGYGRGYKHYGYYNKYNRYKRSNRAYKRNYYKSKRYYRNKYRRYNRYHY